MNYDLPLAEEKVKPHQVTTLHLVCALGFIGTGAIITVYNYTIPMWGGALLAAGILLLGVTLFKNKWLTREVNVPVRVAELLIALAIAIYSVSQQWKFPTGMFAMLSIGILFALYWERKSDAVLYVHADDSGLKLPVLRRRTLPWTEVEEVVLRFGILTINCVDNHLFQWTISDTDIEPGKFEAYCAAQVAAHKSERRNDDW